MLPRPRDLDSPPRLHLLPSGDPGSPRARFLHDPTPDRLRRALEGNQRQWLLRLARYGGELVQRDGGLVWHDAPGVPAGEIHVPFPRLGRDRTGDRLDAFLARLRHRCPPRGVRVWTSEPNRPDDPSAGSGQALPVRLLARGFRPGFSPRWMRLDLWRLRDVRYGSPGLRIEPALDGDLWRRYPHPYHGAGWQDRAAEAAARALPGLVVPFAAWLGSRPVGAATLHLTTGPLGIAGIYDVGVAPEHRNRGIGKAITLEVCKAAWALGCPVAGLNATPLGVPVYARLGFEDVGEGRTWELSADALAAPPPSEVEVRFAEAIGRGDVDALERLAANVTGLLDTRLAGGLTPLQLAARFRQTAAGEWLVGWGATPDPIAAWDLGWRDRAVRLLAEQPELAGARDVEHGATPLHEAARRGDIELASLLLAAGADPRARDAAFDASPWEWAAHFGHAEVTALLGGGPVIAE